MTSVRAARAGFLLDITPAGTITGQPVRDYASGRGLARPSLSNR